MVILYFLATPETMFSGFLSSSCCCAMNNRTLFGTPVREEARSVSDGESGGGSSDVSVSAKVEVAVRGAAMEGGGLLGAGEAVPPGLKNSPISGCRFGDLRGMPVTSALGCIGVERRSSRGVGGAEWLRGRLRGSAMPDFGLK
jgi:hypothetical protein